MSHVDAAAGPHSVSTQTTHVATTTAGVDDECLQCRRCDAVNARRPSSSWWALLRAVFDAAISCVQSVSATDGDAQQVSVCTCNGNSATGRCRVRPQRQTVTNWALEVTRLQQDWSNRHVRHTQLQQQQHGRCHIKMSPHEKSARKETIMELICLPLIKISEVERKSPVNRPARRPLEQDGFLPVNCRPGRLFWGAIL